MLKVLFRARDRFVREQAGNVAILFAVSAIPLLGLMGGAVDFTRHHRYKVELLNAMDATAIALVRSGPESDAEADAFVNQYMAALLPRFVGNEAPARQQAARGSMFSMAAAAAPDAPAPASGARDPMLHMQPFDAVEIEGGWRVVSDGYMDTAFLPLIGMDEMLLDLSSEVMMSGGKFEIALALDNTGSMDLHGRMDALKDASTQLVEDLYREEGTESRVEMALVPFVTAVNIKAGGQFDMDWIEPTGDPEIYGMNFATPQNRLELFDRMQNADWKGCVEARSEALGLDEDDIEPTSADTRFVPYLWPDEPTGYGNSYLPDPSGGSAWDKLRDVAKYRGRAASDTTVRGPNAGCPRPLVPLTNDDELMKAELELMRPHNRITRGEGNNTGTNVAQGLMWAWSVLSPEKPFDQNVADYNDPEVTKVLVLLSDGRNQIVAQGDQVTESDYSSYGYLAAGRLGVTRAEDYEQAELEVDAKVSRICERIKAKGIRLYTILFQVDFDRTQDLFRDCASEDEDGEPLYFYVPEPEQLETAFENIGEDLTTLRLTR
jgi:Mg-chelatase subunit ChlD